jgi:hypothetical protein
LNGGGNGPKGGVMTAKEKKLLEDFEQAFKQDGSRFRGLLELLEDYKQSSRTVQKAIDHTFDCICGYTLKELVGGKMDIDKDLLIDDLQNQCSQGGACELGDCRMEFCKPPMKQDTAFGLIEKISRRHS